MKYKRHIIITLLAMLSLCSVLAHANEDFKIFTDSLNERLNKIQKDIDKRGVTTTTQRQVGGATVTVAKNYPVVPYDPNHPNVKKQSRINIKANAKTLAGRFARGLNAVALTYAVADMLGDGIDWVLDPENNSITYTSDNQYCHSDTCALTPELLCKELASNAQSSESSRYRTSVTVKVKSWDETSCITLTPSFYNPVNNVYHSDYYHSYQITKRPTSKDNSMSLETIANHVINNEDNSTTNVITNNYYNTVNETIIEQITNGEHDNDIETAVRNVSQLDDSPSPNDKTDNKEQPQEQPINENKPQDESKPFELPAFCDWASKVCEFIDWVNQEPPETKKPEVGEITEDDIDWRQYAERKWLNFGNAQCPQDVRIPVQWMTVQQDIVISYVPFCKFATMIKPAVILGAYISALMIISVGRQRE